MYQCVCVFYCLTTLSFAKIIYLLLWMMKRVRSNGGMVPTGRSTKKPATVLFFCPKIRHYRAWDQTQDFVVRGRWLTNEPRPCTLKPSVADCREPSSCWERTYLSSNQEMSSILCNLKVLYVESSESKPVLLPKLFSTWFSLAFCFILPCIHVRKFMWNVNEACWYVSLLKYMNLHTSALSPPFIQRRLKTSSEL